MKRFMFIVLFASIATLFSNVAGASVKEDIKGNWKYKVTDAPYDYQEGQFSIAEVNGKTTATAKFSNGNEIKIPEITLSDNTFSFSLTIESVLVKVTGKVVQGKIVGKVDSSQGLMDLKAERVVPAAR